MSQNIDVVDQRPQMKIIDQPVETEQQFTVTATAGQSMGLLLALTYNQAGTWQSPITN